MILKEKKQNKKVISRINRVVGQISGVRKMIESDRSYEDVIIQIAAIRAALGQLSVVILQNHMGESIPKAIKNGKSEELIDSFNKVMKQMLK